MGKRNIIFTIIQECSGDAETATDMVCRVLGIDDDDEIEIAPARRKRLRRQQQETPTEDATPPSPEEATPPPPQGQKPRLVQSSPPPPPPADEDDDEHEEDDDGNEAQDGIDPKMWYTFDVARQITGYAISSLFGIVKDPKRRVRTKDENGRRLVLGADILRLRDEKNGDYKAGGAY